MILLTYQEILTAVMNRAGRLDKQPPSEQAAALDWIDDGLQTIWQGTVWAELITVAPAAVPVVHHQFSKQEGTMAEMGDILAYYDRQPFTTDDEPWYDFNEGNGVVTVDSHHDSVWPVYLPPCPVLAGAAVWHALTAYAAGQWLQYSGNLAAPPTATPLNFYQVNQATIAGDSPDMVAAKFNPAPLLRGFKNYLAYTGAAELLNADQPGAGDALLLKADRALSQAQLRNWDKLPRWLKQARWPREHRRRHWGLGMCFVGP